MVVWGIVSVSMAFIHDKETFFILRFLLGVAESGFFPGMILYLTYWYPRRQHGRAVARFMTAIPAAGVLGGLIASQVLTMNGILGLAGWKWLFIITGSPSIILGFACLLFLTDNPKSAKWLSDAERSTLLEELSKDHDVSNSPDETTDQSAEQKHASSSTNLGARASLPASVAAERPSVIKVLTNPRVWFFAFLYFLITQGMYGFQLWLPQIIQGITQGSPQSTALLSAIPPLFQALGMEVVARSSDRTGERRVHFAVSACIAAVGLTLAGLLGNPIAALIALCITAFGIWGTVGPFWALPTGFLNRALAVAGIGLINSVGNLGGFAGPYIVGVIKRYSPNFSTALYFMAGAMLLGALLALT
ncbi:MAG: MFS transporter, partial [Terriglobales bacterium]